MEYVNLQGLQISDTACGFSDYLNLCLQTYIHVFHRTDKKGKDIKYRPFTMLTRVKTQDFRFYHETHDFE